MNRSKTESAVMVAYDFPPEGNAGAYRPLRFVRHLKRLGWRLTVVSCTPARYERYDPKLVSLVPPEVEVRRVSFCDPWQQLQARRERRMRAGRSADGDETAQAESQIVNQAAYRILLRRVVRKVEASCYHPDMAMPWIRPAVKASVQACARVRARVIWTTGGPVSSFVVGQRASEITGLPYVLDFRDAWTISYNEFEALRPNWARNRDRRRMFALLKSAQAVVFPYESVAQCFWVAYRGALTAERVHLVPNGFEGQVEGFVGPSVSGNEPCLILYTGTVSSYDYYPLMTALHQLRQTDPSFGNRLKIRFVGEGMKILQNQAKELGLDGIIKTSGPVNQSQIGDLQRNAHALLVFGRPREMTGHELFAGAKLFAYLRSGKPILGVLPHDETRRILERVGVSTIADSGSVSEIIAVLKRLVEAASSREALASLIPRPSACMEYSIERQIDALLRALEGKPASQEFVPGRARVPASLEEFIADGNWVGDTQKSCVATQLC